MTTLHLCVLLVYAFTSLVAFGFYAADKSAARRGDRRIPERSLLMLGLFGGWPGAFMAQRVLRHKTQKTGFQVWFWITVAVNVGAATYAML